MTRDEITSRVQEVLEEALGADPEQVTMEATLTGDLGA
jgi:acyl carrier protein